MIRLEHVNLVMKRIEPTLEFLLTAFPEWRIRGEGESVWNGTQRRWVHVGNDDYYLTLNDQAEGAIRDTQGITPGVAHIGYAVDDLKSIVDRLVGKGYPIAITGRNHPFRKTVYFNDPAGFQFEFIEYSSEIPEEKNMYGGESGELIKPTPIN